MTLRSRRNRPYAVGHLLTVMGASTWSSSLGNVPAFPNARLSNRIATRRSRRGHCRTTWPPPTIVSSRSPLLVRHNPGSSDEKLREAISMQSGRLRRLEGRGLEEPKGKK